MRAGGGEGTASVRRSAPRDGDRMPLSSLLTTPVAAMRLPAVSEQATFQPGGREVWTG